jgi:hypothetical protein
MFQEQAACIIYLNARIYFSNQSGVHFHLLMCKEIRSNLLLLVVLIFCYLDFTFLLVPSFKQARLVFTKEKLISPADVEGQTSTKLW